MPTSEETGTMRDSGSLSGRDASLTTSPPATTVTVEKTQHPTLDNLINGVSPDGGSQDLNSGEKLGPIRYIQQIVDGHDNVKEEKYLESGHPVSGPPDPSVILDIITRTISRGEKASKKLIRIWSPQLVNAIRAVTDFYPGRNLRDMPLEFREPFWFLVHHREKLERYKEQHPRQHNAAYRKECNESIDQLLQIVDAEVGKKVQAELERHQRGVVTFDGLWLLLKPGDKVFLKSEAEKPRRLQSFLVHEVRGGPESGAGSPYWIFAWKIVFDGISSYRRISPIPITEFDGEKEIKSLRLYPQSYHPEFESLQKKLIAWGREYWALATPCLREYSGPVVYPEGHSKAEGRIMVDFTAFDMDHERRERGNDDSAPDTDDMNDEKVREYFASLLSGEDRPPPPALARLSSQIGETKYFCECVECTKVGDVVQTSKFREYDDLRPGQTPTDQDTFYSLCSRQVKGFLLRERKFVVVDIDGIKEPTFDKDAFSYLVLDPALKDMIEKLAIRYEQKVEDGKAPKFTADLIKGKGEGRVFLLHGPPGVGKTCAAGKRPPLLDFISSEANALAECVAERTQRPLLAITSGDLGTNAQDMEFELNRFLHLGERWNAVVLIDEADIYFEERDRNDIKRNSLVSVLLRAMEYFKGLLFLTTNRGRVIDDAFTSRIHVSIEFKKLEKDDMRRIWRNNFDRLQQSEGRPIDVEPSARDYVTSDDRSILSEWNGRDVRNAFQTLVALAIADWQPPDPKPTIKLSHVEEVLRLAKAFQRYLRDKRQGLSEEEAARKRGK